MIVNGEDAQATQEATLARLQRPETTREDFNREFATLTLGSGAAAAVIGPADQHPGRTACSGAWSVQAPSTTSFASAVSRE